MIRRAPAILQADVARALRAAEKVAPGRAVVEIRYPDGTVIRVTTDDGKSSPDVPVALKKEIVL